MTVRQERDDRKSLRSRYIDLGDDFRLFIEEDAVTLRLPDVSGLSLMDAALAYVDAGWYVLPTDPGEIKNPGSVVKGKWHEKSSRDPEQIRRWWKANPRFGIALHCGRSGAGVFDLDVSSLDEVSRSDIAEALAKAGAVQGTRQEGDRGHYLFLLPDDGRIYGNSAGAFTKWGEFRGKNGVIIAAPTPHPDAETKGGVYSQRRTGPVGPMPDVLRECLSEAGESSDPLTDAELSVFLDIHTGGGCGRDDCSHVGNGPVKNFHTAVGDGASRYETLVKVTPWALSEAMAGCYSARELVDALRAAYFDAFDESDGRARLAQRSGEFARVMRWGAGQADVKRAHRNGSLPTAAELESFWTSCPELRDLRQFARARRVGPWAMFGVCAAVAISSVPPYVVLPPLVGNYASLNLFVALVGKSGGIKSAAIRAAMEWLNVEPVANPKKPGSGEGLAKCFAYVKKARGEKPVQIGKSWSVLAQVPEVDTLTAVGGHSGSTLLASLREGWSGERLGIDYGAEDKTIVLQEHRYRLCMTIGVQPLRAEPIFADADAGTPQRFVWFPVSDPDRPKNRPPEPPRLSLPAWPGLTTDVQDDPTDGDEGVLEFDRNTFLASRMDQLVESDKLEVFAVPDAVYEAVDDQAYAVLGEEEGVDPLDGHKLLCREKLAAGIAILRQHRQITDQDWELAGIALAVSDSTRANVLSALSAARNDRNRKAGYAAGARKVAEAERIADEHAEKIARIATRIVEKLTAKNDQTLNAFKKDNFSSADKPFVDEAINELEEEGRISKQVFEYRGRPGVRLHLDDGGDHA